ncbi:MAG: Hpt domain-containing protein [Burkholderiales bacterium]
MINQHNSGENQLALDADVRMYPPAAKCDQEHGGDFTGAIERIALDQIRALQRPGKPDIVSKVIAIYVESTPGLLQAMQDALESNDPAALQRAAHTLKSSSANLGAHILTALCKEIEAIGRANSTSAAQPLVARAHRQYRVAEAELKAYCVAHALKSIT